MECSYGALLESTYLYSPDGSKIVIPYEKSRDVISSYKGGSWFKGTEQRFRKPKHRKKKGSKKIDGNPKTT